MVADQVVVVVERQPLGHLDQVAAHRVQALPDQDEHDEAVAEVRERL